MVPGLRDNMDDLVERLGRLVRVLEKKEFGGSGTELNVSRTVNVDEPDQDNTPTYFSTGPDRIAVTNDDEFERLDLGLVARTVNIRTTDDIVVSFSNPANEGRQLTVRGGDPNAGEENESPFTIGGENGIDTAFLWIKQAPSASGTPMIEVLAYR